MSTLLIQTPEGLYCPAAGVHIDPLRPVARAVITHAHSDHARPGHGAVLATRETLDIMALRLGAGFAGATQPLAYGEALTLDGIRLRLVPAGHVLGSAQVVIEAPGERAVVSGDYKRQEDPTCAPFELVPCDTFVTEATFGLPVFRHPPIAGELARLLASMALFPERTHLVGAYSLGKAQRLIAELRRCGYDRTIYLHGALEKVTAYYISRGVALGPVAPVGPRGKDLAGELVICPPGDLAGRWARRFADPVTAVASGWMRVRARARQRGVSLPLIVSDHVDWPDLCRTVTETGASTVWVTHGAEEALCHWCETVGRNAQPLHMIGYGEEEADSSPAQD
ncbi:ligase-associated DNA damage response exonuclease [Pannonibacter tanglangensis]|uniref:Ligase-associated DNA damage response exonuclease n=1 Tax=Pannonibacter tanglangensis TaxID=2750084 RepID=A0ABW9ZKZ2_9HYPH|nr:ligase-associated DNA damage response exonuclease [Pannonibacter sp. XCT-34]NBN64266.1 ligase-associated DNA damage response exonuclease [Pannonibacter sp. XCT-34]